MNAFTDTALKPGAIREKLAAGGCLSGIEVLEEVVSTNDEAAERARGGAAPWRAVLAEAQTGGRGRRGRAWDSPPGKNLYLSLTLPPVRDPAALGPLPLALGLALAEALGQRAPRIRVKWPNDLVSEFGAKLGGILLEVEPASGQVVLGLGLNVNAVPTDGKADGEELVRTSMAELVGGGLERNAVAALVLKALIRGWEEYMAAGFGPLRGRFLQLAWGLGREVRIVEAERTLTGRYQDVDDGGRLVLVGKAGPVSLATGDLSLRSDDGDGP